MLRAWNAGLAVAGLLAAPVAGLGALIGLLALMATLSDESAFAYRGGILLSSILTLLVIAAMIAPLSSYWHSVRVSALRITASCHSSGIDR